MIVARLASFSGIESANFRTDIARLKVSSWFGVKTMKAAKDFVVSGSILACVFLSLYSLAGPLLFLGMVALLGLIYRRTRVLLASQVTAPVSIVFRRAPRRRRPNH
jgi:hypothetical protein